MKIISSVFRERIAYGLISSKKTKKHKFLSGIVVVVDEVGKGYCSIKFTEELVKYIAKVLPAGLSLEDKAFLKVHYYKYAKKWKVYALYVKTGYGRLLWSVDEKPKWIQDVIYTRKKGNEIL